MNPVINITHLERYQMDRTDQEDCDKRNLNRLDFEDLPKFKVESIIAERMMKRNNRNERQYRVRFTGYAPEFDKWLTRSQLKNAPEVLIDWER